jgi:hypothetical protein
MENRSPAVWVGKTMLDPTVDPDVSIDVRNPVAKRGNQKSLPYCRGTVSFRAAHNDIKVSIAETHMERRVGMNVRLT